MGKSITDIVNSIFKSKQKQVSNIRYKNKGTGYFKKTLKALGKSDANSLLGIAETAELYTDKTGKHIIHIKDEQLSKLLYQKIILLKENKDNLPKEFESVEFLADQSDEKIIFITYESETDYADRVEQQYILSNLACLVSSFCDNFSTDEVKIYVDYKIFITQFIGNKISFLGSLFLSTVTQKPGFNETELQTIINHLLVFSCDVYGFGFSDLQNAIRKGESEFYRNIQNGIYVKDLEPEDYPYDYSFSSLPVYLYVNMFKAAINENTFNSCEEFFDGSKIEQFENNLEEEKFVFDEQLLLSQLNKTSELETFIRYELKSKATEVYLKVKDNSKIIKIKEILKDLAERCFINSDIKFYSTLENDNCYIVYEASMSNYTPLSLHISELATWVDSDKQLSDLIWTMYSTFSENSDLKKKIYFDKNINLTNVMAFDGSYFTFTNISAMSFEASENNIGFEYPLLIMQTIEKFVSEVGWCEDDIYKDSYMKMLSPGFANSTIEYLNSKQYTSSGMIRKLRDILPPVQAKYVEFLEDINVEDDFAIERMTFADSAKTNNATKDVITSILERQKALKPSKENGKYLSLEKCTKAIFNGKELKLNQKTLKGLFYDFKLQNVVRLLTISKVIVSRSLTENGQYKIVGVVWNKSRMYRLTERINAKKITPDQMYNIIYQLLEEYMWNNYSISNLLSIEDILLEDDAMGKSYDVVLNFNNSANILKRSTKTLRNYYSYVLQTIKKTIDSGLGDFPYFDYATLVEDYEDYAEPNQLEVFKRSIINGISKCKYHNTWYLNQDFCPICKRMYIVNDEPLGAGMYSDEILHFTESEEEDDYIFAIIHGRKRREIIEQTKLGLEYNIYENIENQLAPQKLVINDYSGNIENNIRAMAYFYYDFEQVLRLESFKEFQRLKVVLVMYKKVLPYILNGSFISNYKEIFTTMFMDRANKGQLLMPNITLLDSKTIISSDETLKLQKQEETKKVFSEFLQEYITSDDALKVELKNNSELLVNILEDIKACNFSESVIKEYLVSKDSYCRVHDVHFSSEVGICPECIENGITVKDTICYNEQYFDNLLNSTPMYEGGEATLYAFENNQVQKIFNKTVNLELKSQILGKALQKAKLFEQFNKEHEDVKIVSVNKLLYSRENNVLTLRGYAEDLIEDSFKISMFKDQSFVKKMGYTRRDIITILMKACKGINFLHSIGGFIGDLNGGNIVIKDGAVYIIDIDGMSFDEVKNCVYTDMYIYPPSAESKNITSADDWYSFAIQAFYYLTYSHPFKGVCNLPKVPSSEIERMKQGISVLGNHGINVPTISIGWEFMPKYVVQFFFDTFEGAKRENMYSVLERYLKDIEKNMLNFKKIERAKKVKVSVTENLYVDVKNKLYYKEQLKATLAETDQLILCNNHLIVTDELKTLIVSDDTGDILKFDKAYDINNILRVVNGKIYYTSDSKYTLYVDELDSQTGKVNTHEIKTDTQNQILSLYVCGENKLIFVDDNVYDNTLDIYCNTMKIESVSKTRFSGETATSILYDEIMSRWLVLFEGNDGAYGVVIDKNLGQVCSRFELSEQLSSSICFQGNILYYVGQGKIFYYSVLSNKLRAFESDIVNIDSRIKRISNKFVINNKDEAYVYYKS